MSSLDGSTAHSAPGPGYEALVSGVAYRIATERRLLRIDGKRAVDVLNGLLSADIAALSPGEYALSFVLTSRGRPVAVPRVLRVEEAILLDVSRAAEPGLLEHFATYLPPRLATVTVLEEACHVSLLGPAAATVTGQLDLTHSLFQLERVPEEGPGMDLYFLEDTHLATIQAATVAAGGAVAATPDYEAWRIELGLPLFGRDITLDNLPQETGLVPRAVSFEKGCYTGQEVVARIHYRGQVNRHLRGIRPDGDYSGPSPAPGTEVTRQGRAVGATTSWCVSPRFGPIGLGYVRRELSVGDAVEVACDPPFHGLVTELPFTST